jgi:DNA-binding transcriptional LysR family regulator
VGFPYDLVLQQIEAVAGEKATVTQRFRDNGIIEALVASGEGISILPRYTTRDHENGLTTRPLTGVATQRQLSALMRPDRAERPSVRAVIEILRAEGAKVQAAHSS